MKRILHVVIILVICVLSACGGPHTSTTSMLLVVDKGHSSDYEEYWIQAYDPNNQTKEEAFKIIVEEEMVWNLIEEEKEYFSTYKKKGNKPLKLTAIEHVLIKSK